MLAAVMKECNNHFIKSVKKGTFTIEDGGLGPTTDYLPGQYILIVGSVLKDGVYQMGDESHILDEISNEEFEGTVCGLTVPREFLALVEEIRDFCENEKQENPSVVSETYKGYSYTKATGQSGAAVSWKEAFRTRLNGYRRMFPERI